MALLGGGLLGLMPIIRRRLKTNNPTKGQGDRPQVKPKEHRLRTKKNHNVIALVQRLDFARLSFYQHGVASEFAWHVTL